MCILILLAGFPWRKFLTSGVLKPLSPATAGPRTHSVQLPLEGILHSESCLTLGIVLSQWCLLKLLICSHTILRQQSAQGVGFIQPHILSFAL